MIQTLRSLSRDGRTVLFSIHQPSSEVFALFDNLFILSGGRTIYFGPAARAHEVRICVCVCVCVLCVLCVLRRNGGGTEFES